MGHTMLPAVYPGRLDLAVLLSAVLFFSPRLTFAQTLVNVDAKSQHAVESLQMPTPVALSKTLSEDGSTPPKHRSRRKAAIIGGLVGAGIGLFTANFSDCPSGSRHCPGARVAAFVVASGVGAAVGVGINTVFADATSVRASPASLGAHRRSMHRLAFALTKRW